MSILEFYRVRIRRVAVPDPFPRNRDDARRVFVCRENDGLVGVFTYVTLGVGWDADGGAGIAAEYRAHWFVVFPVLRKEGVGLDVADSARTTTYLSDMRCITVVHHVAF